MKLSVCGSKRRSKTDRIDQVCEGVSIMIQTVRRTLPALLLALSLPAAVRAAVYVPNSTADSDDGACGAVCSLRDAVAAANLHAGEDVILLHAGIYAASSLQIQGDLVLIGDGAGRSVVDGGAGGGILTVPAGVTVQIQDVTLRNGRAAGGGGAIHNSGVLTVQRSILSGNAAVSGAGGAGFGGAILSSGSGSSLTLTDSAVSGNTAQAGGGGLALGGAIALANVTISGNRSQSDFGGGLYLFSDVRGTVNNATIAGNSAGLKGGGAFLESSAFIGVSPKVTNSILAGNTAPSEPDCSGAIDSAYDLIGNGAGCNGPAAVKGDQVGTGATPVDPRLGALGDNGGPTPTRALLAGSPAIDAANPAAPGSGGGACEATDQRGVHRPGGSRCDVGAFEASTACVAGDGALCLSGGRFRVSATFQAPNGGPAGAAHGVALTPDSGYFWFFDPTNVELTVKVLNGCNSNNHYWVFAAGLTNVNVVLTVTDTATGQTKSYTNPQGRTYRSILDTVAFATCPYIPG
jgi:CSLREA domain-containing protein